MPIRTRVTIVPKSGSNVEADGLLFEVCPQKGDSIVVEVIDGSPRSVYAGKVTQVVHHGRPPGGSQDPYVAIVAEMVSP